MVQEKHTFDCDLASRSFCAILVVVDDDSELGVLFYSDERHGQDVCKVGFRGSHLVTVIQLNFNAILKPCDISWLGDV